MRLSIFGSTGNIGKEVLKAALRQGHEVQTLVRSPAKLTNSEARVIEGSLADEEKVRETINGTEAVLWAIGATKRKGDNLELYKEALTIVLDEMKKNGITRIVLLAGETLEMPEERFTPLRRMKRLFLRSLLARVPQTNEALRDILLKHEDLDWTILRPVFIVTKNRPAGRVNANIEKAPGARIDAADLGEFFVEQINEKSFIRKAPLLASLYS